MDHNASGFTYAVNAPWVGPIADFSAGGSYDMQFNAQYGGGGGQMSFRTRNGDVGSWNSWQQVVTTGNINSYAPTLTGGGASGTWAIDITGRAGKLNSYAATPNNSHPGWGVEAFYNWGTSNGAGGSPSDSSYSNGITIGSNPGDQAYGFQIVQNMWDDNLYFRRYNGGWQSWNRALSTINDPYPSNMNQYVRTSDAPTFAGLTLNGNLSINGSISLNDSKIYLRGNGDANHYLWNADDDWEELVAYQATGFRVKSSAGSVLMTVSTSGVTTSNTLTIGGGGSLNFATANPYLNSGGSYFVIPNGAYFSGGTAYFQNQLQARGGVNNDQGTLTLSASNSQIQINGNSNTSGTAVAAYLQVTSNVTSGAGCGTLGMIAKDGNGVIYACQN